MIKSMDFHVEGVLYYNSAKFLLFVIINKLNVTSWNKIGILHL